MKRKTVLQITILLISIIALCTLLGIVQSIAASTRVLTSAPLAMTIALEAGIGLCLCVFIACIGWLLVKRRH